MIGIATKALKAEPWDLQGFVYELWKTVTAIGQTRKHVQPRHILVTTYPKGLIT